MQTLTDDKPFNLTVKQLEAYLDYCESQGKVAGIAVSSHRCPLACAYKHTYGETADVGWPGVVLGKTVQRLNNWQRIFVHLIDEPAINIYEDYPISVEQAREALKKAIEKDGEQ